MAPSEAEDRPAVHRAATFWQHKPWWCQPWSILLTGSLAIALDWLVYRWVSIPLWLALPPVVGVLGWWFLFLVLVPAADLDPDGH
jgi:hypothetical protein